MSYSREDVQTHYGADRPAVNVKVNDTIEDGYRDFRKWEPDAHPAFTLDWIRENVSDERIDARFWTTCEMQWEQVEQDAADIFGAGVTVERDGRSGGWAVVRGLPPIDEWDAVRLGKWRRFERYARYIADEVMGELVTSLYLNEWEIWRDERSERVGGAAFSPEVRREAVAA